MEARVCTMRLSNTGHTAPTDTTGRVCGFDLSSRSCVYPARNHAHPGTSRRVRPTALPTVHRRATRGRTWVRATPRASVKMVGRPATVYCRAPRTPPAMRANATRDLHTPPPNAHREFSIPNLKTNGQIKEQTNKQSMSAAQKGHVRGVAEVAKGRGVLVGPRILEERRHLKGVPRKGPLGTQLLLAWLVGTAQRGAHPAQPRRCATDQLQMHVARKRVGTRAHVQVARPVRAVNLRRQRERRTLCHQSHAHVPIHIQADK